MRGNYNRPASHDLGLVTLQYMELYVALNDSRKNLKSIFEVYDISGN